MKTYGEDCEEVCNMPRLPTYTTAGKNNTAGAAKQAVGNRWCRYIFYR